MGFRTRIGPIFVTALAVSVTSSAFADSYQKLIERRIQIQDTLDQAMAIDADGGVWEGHWQSMDRLRRELDRTESDLQMETKRDTQKALAQINMIILARNYTRQSHDIIERSEDHLSSGDELQLYKSLRLVNEGLSSVKVHTAPGKDELLEIERLLQENNISLLRALTKFPKLQKSNLIGRKAYQLYHFDFDTNERFGLRHSSKGRLQKAHEERFVRIGISTKRGLGLQSLPLRVKNGHQEAVVHGAILLGRDFSLPWLHQVQNEHQVAYVLQLFSVAFANPHHQDLFEFLSLGLNADRLSLIDSNESQRRLLLLELEKLSDALKTDCETLLKN